MQAEATTSDPMDELFLNLETAFIPTTPELVECSNTFFHSGITVIPIIPEDMVNELCKAIDERVENFPEFNKVPGKPGFKLRRVLGGFGALGNPSSFHDELIRELRVYLKKVLMPFWDDLGERLKLQRLELLFDRLCYRYDDSKPQAEAWHRDKTSNLLSTKNGSSCSKKEKDVIGGGWFNISSVTQKFHGIISSDLDELECDDGFTPLPTPTDQSYATRMLYNPNTEPEMCDPDTGAILVPPGHMVLFRQGIIHEIVSKKMPANLRLFFGFRLTNHHEPLFGAQEEWMKTGAVPLLPSGQKAPMYSIIHENTTIPVVVKIGKPVNAEFDIRTWAKEAFPESMLHAVRDTGCFLPPQHMPSLKELNLPVPDYTGEQISCMTPDILNWCTKDYQNAKRAKLA